MSLEILLPIVLYLFFIVTNKIYLLRTVKFSLKTSKETPLVSGIIKCTKKSCKTIIAAKKRKTTPAPIVVNKTGTKEGIIAANTQ